MEKLYKEQSERVAAYYNEWHDRYNQVYGKTIQAHRPPAERDLLDYTIKSAGLANNQQILDAGCGNCGPAIYIANKLKVKIEAVTISARQAQEATDRVAAARLASQIKVKQGDYHELDVLYSADSFDKVLFLEALGHSGQPAAAISAAYKVLKPGGEIYIKDFYPKHPKDTALLEKINKVVANLNRSYNYNALDLNATINALRESNFEIAFIKQIDFKNDASVKNDFENRFGISLFEGEQEFYFAEWLEIKCFKPR